PENVNSTNFASVRACLFSKWSELFPRRGDRSDLSLVVRRSDENHRTRGLVRAWRRVRGRIPVQAQGRQLFADARNVPEMNDVIPAGRQLGAIGAEGRTEKTGRGNAAGVQRRDLLTGLRVEKPHAAGVIGREQPDISRKRQSAETRADLDR